MQAGAVATKGVLGDACAAGYRERSGMADGGARVPEVLSAAELEGFFAGIVPELLEPALGASMGEEVEEAQELAVDAPGSAHDARQEGVGNTGPRGVGLTVAMERLTTSDPAWQQQLAQVRYGDGEDGGYADVDRDLDGIY